MREGWEIKEWSEVLDIKSGKNQKEVLNPNGKYPILGSAGKVMGYADDYICEAGTTIIGRKGTINNPLFIKEKFWNVDTAFGLHTSEQLDKNYFHYFCLSFDFTEMDKGSGRPSLVKKDLLKISIPIPPLAEQQQIVAILDKAFTAIDTAKANIKKNIENAKELYQSKLNQIFSQTGDGWEEKTLGEVFKLKSGDGLTAKKMIEGPYPVYGGNGIAGYHNVNNFEPPQVIIGRVGALCGNVRHIKDKFWLTDNAFRISVGLDNFDNDFVTYLLNYKNLRNFARQAAQPVVSNSSLKNVPLSFPSSVDEQVKIRKKLRNIESELNKLNASYKSKLTNLEELKKSILQKAFAGELTNKEVQI